MSVSSATSSALGTFSMSMLVCSNVAASRDYYRDVFGLRVTFDNPAWTTLELAPGVSLALHPREPENHLDVQPGSTFLAFAVADTDGFVARASELGARVAAPPHDEPFGRLAIVLDPDGYPWQIVTLAPQAA